MPKCEFKGCKYEGLCVVANLDKPRMLCSFHDTFIRLNGWTILANDKVSSPVFFHGAV